MAYSAISVANSIIKLAKERGIDDLSPLKLQKLMYFCQYWYLKNFNKLLINDNFVRWKYGPVIPSIYYELKSYNNKPIEKPIRQLSPNNEAVVFVMADNDRSSWALVERVLDVYGGMDAITLSAITHREGSSWQKGEVGSVITKADMMGAAL